jgi:hypothetical protein
MLSGTEEHRHCPYLTSASVLITCRNPPGGPCPQGPSQLGFLSTWVPDLSPELSMGPALWLWHWDAEGSQVHGSEARPEDFATLVGESLGQG